MRKFPLSLSSKERMGVYLLLPLLVWLAVVLLYPLGYVIMLSFFRRDPATNVFQFQGFTHFSNLLLRDNSFWQALLRSLRWTVTNVTVQFTVGILTALLLRQQGRGRALIRTSVILPWITPVAVVALVWRWMLNPTLGIFESALRHVGLLEGYLNLLGNVNTVMATMIAIHSWRSFPFVAITLLGRMLGIPEELYEAARVDGASKIQGFLHITLPQLRGVMLTFLMLATVWTFTSFDTIFLISGGGPINFTTTLPILAYRKAFQTYQLNEAAALSVIMFLITSVFMVLYIKLGVEDSD